MTESEWVTDIRHGYRTKIVQTDNAKIIIHRPLLAPEEQTRREAEVIQALSNFGKELKK